MKKKLLITILVLIAGFVNAQLAESPWPTFHGDLQRTGLSSYDTTYINGTLKWSFQTGDGIESSPVIGTNGTIYIGSHDGYLYTISREGELKWKTKIGTPIEKEGWGHTSSTSSTPAIAKDGTIYIASRDQYLFAISSDGKEKWKFPIGVNFDSWASPAIGKDGTIYMTSASPKGGVYAINPNGTEKWHYSIEMGTSNSPTVDKDGTIYAAFPTSTKTNALIALNLDGTKKWELATELFLESSPTISNDTIYIGSYTDAQSGAGLYAISISEKKIKWHLTLPEKEVMSTPAIAKDGTIYFGTVYGVFYAAKPDGTIKWSFNTGKELSSSAAIGSDGTIYFGSSNGIFYALNPNGTEKWHYTTSSIASSPAIDEDGTIYIGSWDGKLYAFGEKKKAKEIIQKNKESLPKDTEGTESKNAEDVPFYEETTCEGTDCTTEGSDKETVCGNNVCKEGKKSNCPTDCNNDLKEKDAKTPLTEEKKSIQESVSFMNLFQKIIEWFLSLFK